MGCGKLLVIVHFTTIFFVNFKLWPVNGRTYFSSREIFSSGLISLPLPEPWRISGNEIPSSFWNFRDFLSLILTSIFCWRLPICLGQKIAEILADFPSERLKIFGNIEKCCCRSSLSRGIHPLHTFQSIFQPPPSQ